MKNRAAVGWLDLLTGVLFLALGIVLMRTPRLAVSGLSASLGIVAAISGLSDIAMVARLRKEGGESIPPLLLTGIVSTVAGVLILLYPVIGRGILNVVVPVWFIVRCLSRIAGLGFFRQATGGRLSTGMLCLNVVGLLFGIIMIFNQALFTMSLGGLIALELMILGLGNVMEAFSPTSTPEPIRKESE